MTDALAAAGRAAVPLAGTSPGGGPGAAPLRLPKSIATVCLSGTLPDKLEAVSKAGFDSVEIFENDLLTYDGSPAEVGRMVRDLGLTVSLFQPFRDFEAMPEPQRGRNLDRAERKFDTMGALGAELVLVCSNVQAATLDDPARAAGDLAAMAERASLRGMRVGYEALAWGRRTNRWHQAWDIVRRGAHPALGLIVDSFHTLCLADDPGGIADVPPDRIFFVHLADAPRLDMDVLSWSRHFRSFPGQGELLVAGFLRAVLAAGYRGPLSLEIFNDEFRAAPARQTARDGLRSLILVETEAQADPGSAHPGAAADLPPPPLLDGVEFLEFAVDETAGAELAGFLGALGFRLAGRHRSKAVELYRQGGINLVLNGEPDSAASEHFEAHGPSVCGIALRVDDAARTVRRAEALLCSTWQERVGEGERRIPAVRAPDGTLVYLVETGGQGRSIWEDDFHLAPAADGAAPDGLDRIDHVAHALAPGQMDAFVLFWRAVFGLLPQPLWELPDPYGIVRSRAMVSPGGRVRLPLNISEGRQTATGRFVSAISGAGVHHVAFSYADAASILDAGAPHAAMLPIPENYYDDLEARFSLPGERVGTFRSLNLLYDRDEAGGEFLHAYTTAFADRFFFEIVQRSDGYAQFGAVNAAMRMAAQARARSARGRGGRPGA